jgi:hypothetical protein
MVTSKVGEPDFRLRRGICNGTMRMTGLDRSAWLVGEHINADFLPLSDSSAEPERRLIHTSRLVSRSTFASML